MKIRVLPRGYIVRRTRNRIEYAYLYKREGSKIESQYLGHSNTPQAQQFMKSVEERRRLAARCRQLDREIKEIRRQYRVRRRRV